MANNRLWYASESVSFATHGSTTYTALHGAQSAGLNTRFNLEQVFELGQAEIYEDAERQPDIEVTLEKVLDGYPLMWHLSTRGATAGTLAGRSNSRCMIGVSLYSDVQDSASGTPIKQVVCSGMYPSQISYDFTVNKPFMENMTFVGNDATWGTGLFSAPTFDNTDSPLAITGSGGVNMREDFILGEQAGTKTLLPTQVEGVSSSGTVAMVTGTPSVYLQSVKVSSNFGRDAIYSLGKRGACYRYMQVPTQVETSIEVLSKQGHGVNAYEEATNLSEETIYIKIREGTTIDLGNKNKLMSVGMNLGSAGGGGSNNATTSYSYRTFGKFLVSHPNDPSGL